LAAVYADNVLVAALPLKVARKWGRTYVTQPPFVQGPGYLFAPLPAQPYKAWSQQTAYLHAISNAVPHYLQVAFTTAPGQLYTAPFAWAGFATRVADTWQLDVRQANWAVIRGGFESKLRRNLQAAEKQGIMVGPSLETDGLLRALAEGLGNKVLRSPERALLLHNLATWAMVSGAGFVLEATDASGTLLAAALFLRSENRLIYTAGSRTKAGLATDAASLILARALDVATTEGRIFDFEGSMHPGIQAFFRRFGAHPVPYLFLQRKHVLLRLYNAIKQ
jgi:hypothetical protein